MTRDEVLKRLDRMADKANMESMSSWGLSQPTMAAEKRKQAELLRAAAELIRAGGWRPIADAPEGKELLVGGWVDDYWDTDIIWKHTALDYEYTHYLPEPEPPAREVDNG